MILNKEEKFELIKKWDEEVVFNHCSNEIREISSFFNEKGVKNINFIDIGANVGKFYEILSKQFNIDLCLMVEPNPDIYNYLAIKYRGFRNVKLFNFALSESDGNGYVSDNDYSSESFNLGVSRLFSSGSPVKIVDSYKFLKESLSEEINFVKIDTENSDYKVLKALFEIISKIKSRPIVAFEHNCEKNNHEYEESRIIYNKFISIGYNGLKFDSLIGDSILRP